MTFKTLDIEDVEDSAFQLCIVSMRDTRHTSRY